MAQAKRPAKAAPATPEKKVRDAKRIATQAINEAAQIHADVSANRSTRTRSAYKVKAAALDEVARVLAAR